MCAGCNQCRGRDGASPLPRPAHRVHPPSLDTARGWIQRAVHCSARIEHPRLPSQQRAGLRRRPLALLGHLPPSLLLASTDPPCPAHSDCAHVQPCHSPLVRAPPPAPSLSLPRPLTRHPRTGAPAAAKPASTGFSALLIRIPLARIHPANAQTTRRLRRPTRLFRRPLDLALWQRRARSVPALCDPVPLRCRVSAECDPVTLRPGTRHLAGPDHVPLWPARRLVPARSGPLPFWQHGPKTRRDGPLWRPRTDGNARAERRTLWPGVSGPGERWPVWREHRSPLERALWRFECGTRLGRPLWPAATPTTAAATTTTTAVDQPLWPVADGCDRVPLWLQARVRRPLWRLDGDCTLPVWAAVRARHHPQARRPSPPFALRAQHRVAPRGAQGRVGPAEPQVPLPGLLLQRAPRGTLPRDVCAAGAGDGRGEVGAREEGEPRARAVRLLAPLHALTEEDRVADELELAPPRGAASSPPSRSGSPRSTSASRRSPCARRSTPRSSPSCTRTSARCRRPTRSRPRSGRSARSRTRSRCTRA